MKTIILFCAFICGVFAMEEATPQFLYKVLSADDWHSSQGQSLLTLCSDDDQFIHFSKEDQLDRIVNKYWAHVPDFYVLKIDTEKLPGEMKFEVNPGGLSKYYHLYNGSIPLDAVAEVVKKKR